MTTGTTFQRARRPEQKQQRQDTILGAARQLALDHGVRNVNLTDIADKVGIHKSALLRYFETREQIFLELTAEAWRGWAQALHAELDGASPGSAELVAEVVARSFADRPLLCDLILHTALNLERHVSAGAVRRYKLTSLGVISDAMKSPSSADGSQSFFRLFQVASSISTPSGVAWISLNSPIARWKATFGSVSLKS